MRVSNVVLVMLCPSLSKLERTKIFHLANICHLFINDLFNVAVSSSEYTASNDGMVNE
jgi:hypothetical protein